MRIMINPAMDPLSSISGPYGIESAKFTARGVATMAAEGEALRLSLDWGDAPPDGATIKGKKKFNLNGQLIVNAEIVAPDKFEPKFAITNSVKDKQTAEINFDGDEALDKIAGKLSNQATISVQGVAFDKGFGDNTAKWVRTPVRKWTILREKVVVPPVEPPPVEPPPVEPPPIDPPPVDPNKPSIPVEDVISIFTKLRDFLDLEIKAMKDAVKEK